MRKGIVLIAVKENAERLKKELLNYGWVVLVSTSPKTIRRYIKEQDIAGVILDSTLGLSEWFRREQILLVLSDSVTDSRAILKQGHYFYAVEHTVSPEIIAERFDEKYRAWGEGRIFDVLTEFDITPEQTGYHEIYEMMECLISAAVPAGEVKTKIRELIQQGEQQDEKYRSRLTRIVRGSLDRLGEDAERLYRFEQKGKKSPDTVSLIEKIYQTVIS